MLATLVLLYCGKILGTVRLPELSMASLSQVWPLPLFYLGNLVFGLAGTQALSLPMLTVLRRFSILITMIGQTSQGKFNYGQPPKKTLKKWIPLKFEL